MDQQDDRNPSVPSGPIEGGERVEVPVTTTRRSFLGNVGKKTAYITPVLLTLTAAPAMATGHAASCAPAGGSCTTDNDCCSNSCTGGICD